MAAFVDFYVTDGIRAVEDVGYVHVPKDQFDQSVKAWTDRLVGTRES